jgi:hypothetical protein
MMTDKCVSPEILELLAQLPPDGLKAIENVPDEVLLTAPATLDKLNTLLEADQRAKVKIESQLKQMTESYEHHARQIKTAVDGAKSLCNSASVMASGKNRRSSVSANTDTGEDVPHRATMEMAWAISAATSYRLIFDLSLVVVGYIHIPRIMSLVDFTTIQVLEMKPDTIHTAKVDFYSYKICFGGLTNRIERFYSIDRDHLCLVTTIPLSLVVPTGFTRRPMSDWVDETHKIKSGRSVIVDISKLKHHLRTGYDCYDDKVPCTIELEHPQRGKLVKYKGQHLRLYTVIHNGYRTKFGCLTPPSDDIKIPFMIPGHQAFCCPMSLGVGNELLFVGTDRLWHWTQDAWCQITIPSPVERQNIIRYAWFTQPPLIQLIAMLRPADSISCYTNVEKENKEPNVNLHCYEPVDRNTSSAWGNPKHPILRCAFDVSVRKWIFYPIVTSNDDYGQFGQLYDCMRLMRGASHAGDYLFINSIGTKDFDKCLVVDVSNPLHWITRRLALYNARQSIAV